MTSFPSGQHGKIMVWVYEGVVVNANGDVVDPKMCPPAPITPDGFDCPIIGALFDDILPDFDLEDLPSAGGQDGSPGGQQRYFYCSGPQGCSPVYNCISNGGAEGGRVLLENAALLFGGMVSSVSGCMVD